LTGATVSMMDGQRDKRRMIKLCVHSARMLERRGRGRVQACVHGSTAGDASSNIQRAMINRRRCAPTIIGPIAQANCSFIACWGSAGWPRWSIVVDDIAMA
jgi:hypothetical protein